MFPTNTLMIEDVFDDFSTTIDTVVTILDSEIINASENMLDSQWGGVLLSMSLQEVLLPVLFSSGTI